MPSWPALPRARNCPALLASSRPGPPLAPPPTHGGSALPVSPRHAPLPTLQRTPPPLASSRLAQPAPPLSAPPSTPVLLPSRPSHIAPCKRPPRQPTGNAVRGTAQAAVRSHGPGMAAAGGRERIRNGSCCVEGGGGPQEPAEWRGRGKLRERRQSNGAPRRSKRRDREKRGGRQAVPCVQSVDRNGTQRQSSERWGGRGSRPPP